MRNYAFEVPFIVLTWLYFLAIWLPGHAQAAHLIGASTLALLPFVLPFLLFEVASDARMEYVWIKKYSKTDHCLLEIRLPEEIIQSPYAMELVLRGIYQTGVQTPFHAKWLGDTPAWFSLEMVSTGGRVRFFIWMRRKYKELVENQLYAHYPTVQVVEVPDYTLSVPLDPAVMTVAGVEFALQKPDPYPILTYVEIGLDKQEAKEEFKHDPLASVLEYLGSLKEGENGWIQFVIRAHDKGAPCSYAPAEHGHGGMDLEEWAKAEVDAVNKKAEITVEGKKATDFFKLTTVDRDMQKAIQMKLNKQLFEVGIRTLYIAPKAKVQSAAMVSFPSAFRSFEHGSSGRGLNGLKPIFWLGPFNVPWHDFMDIRRHMLWRRYYDAYTTRQFFYPPHKHPFIVLNTEELATLFHFPGKVARTPTLERMPSKRGEAPSNLPV